MTIPPSKVEFGRTATDYRQFRAGFPQEFFTRLSQEGFGGTGSRVLDLGTGTGTVARGMALLGSEVVAVDRSAEMIAQAKVLDREAGVAPQYIVASAEDTQLSDSFFDVVIAGQCWHWFRRDKAAAEVWRVLKHGGAAVIAHFDWIPLPDNVVASTESLILRFNPDWTMSGGSGLHPEWLSDLAMAGFESLETFSFDVPVEYTHEAWRGRIRASAGVAASLPPDEVKRFDGELTDLLASEYPEDPLAVPHRVFAAIGRKPPAHSDVNDSEVIHSDGRSLLP